MGAAKIWRGAAKCQGGMARFQIVAAPLAQVAAPWRSVESDASRLLMKMAQPRVYCASPHGPVWSGTPGMLSMATTTHSRIVEQLKALAAHLTARREALIQAWEKAIEDDPELTTPDSLSVTHFRDLIPKVLESFEARLRTTGFDESVLSAEEHERVLEHGVHRWEQGFSLEELVREWQHLQLTIQEELERYAAALPGVEPATMATARRLCTEVCGEGIAESVAQYARLQQAEAEGHLLDLQQALGQLKDLDRRRAE